LNLDHRFVHHANGTRREGKDKRWAVGSYSSRDTRATRKFLIPEACMFDALTEYAHCGFTAA
jgi:hypothetical protein